MGGETYDITVIGWETNYKSVLSFMKRLYKMSYDEEGDFIEPDFSEITDMEIWEEHDLLPGNDFSYEEIMEAHGEYDEDFTMLIQNEVLGPGFKITYGNNHGAQPIHCSNFFVNFYTEETSEVSISEAVKIEYDIVKKYPELEGEIKIISVSISSE